jgi:hypothetical protein
VIARRLPVRVVPVPGEAIDSWLEATAERMEVSLGAIARTLDLPSATRPTWIRWLSPEQLETIEAATGVSSNAVEAMTLSVYDGTALRLDPDTHCLDEKFPFGALSWSRYCPECLSESQGRWQLAWRLGWSFVCVLHNALLADVCPNCGNHQRRQQVYRRVPTPTMCVCGHALCATQTVKLPADHVIVEAQQQVSDVINDVDTSFDVFEANRRGVREVLAAVRNLTNRVLNYASTHGFVAVMPEDISSGLLEDVLALKPLRARNALNERAPSRALETAMGVAAALAILGAPTIAKAGARARWLIDGQNADTGPAELRSCARDGTIASAIVIEASSYSMGPELELRYRTWIDSPCAPDLDQRRIQSIAAALPRAMWPAWSERLLPDLRRTAVARMTLSCATLLAGSTVKPVTAARLLGQAITPNALNHRLWVLRSSAYWQSICAALIRLSDHLDSFGASIDYQRRRHLDYSELLPEDAWREICTQTGDSHGEPGTAIGARCYLIEKLSGTPAIGLLAMNEELDGRGLVALVNDFRRSMTVRLVVLLDDYAQGFLAQRGIDEPVAWHPPLNLLVDLQLPGPG